MPSGPEQSDDTQGVALEMDFREASFPSDTLSVKRFRALFPRHFDCPESIADGYSKNDFFLPQNPNEPVHLVRLTELICDERIVASGAFYQCYVDRHPELLEEEDHKIIGEAKQRLEDNYQLFRLADSPETARLLIRQVEDEGTNQGLRRLSKGR
jgi:hypothetical protein